MGYYPLFLNVAGRRCLVVGQGRLAAEKGAQLTRAGAAVTGLASFDETAAAGCWLIIVESDDEVEIARIRRFADERQIPLNVIDRLCDCSFITPAILERESLLVAVSTSGHCPALAVQIRDELEERYGPEYGPLLDVLADIRPLVKKRFATYEQRKEFYRRALERNLPEVARARGAVAVREDLIRLMES